MRFASLGLAACLAAGVSSTCLGQDLPATEQFSDTTVTFKIERQFGLLTLTVAGPNGYFASATARTASPIIELKNSGGYDDGSYSYNLTASTDEKVPVRTPLDNGRDGGRADSRLKQVSLSGHFLVKGGTIVKPSYAQPARHDKDAK